MGNEPWLPLLTEVLRAFVEPADGEQELGSRMCRAVASTLGVGCALDLLGEDGKFWATSLHCPNPGQKDVGEPRMFEPGHPALLRALATDGARLAAADAEGSSEPGASSAILVPLRHRGEVLGVLTLTRQPGCGAPFDEEHVRFADQLGSLAALCFDRARQTQGHRFFEASRLKGEFLANMSHELRTPLNAIIGFSSLLHAGKTGKLTATQTEYLGDILVSSRHLLQLINDVVDLAKVEAGRVEPSPEKVDLTRILDEVRDVLRGLAAEKRVEVSYRADQGLGEVNTDPRLLKQVIYNLVSNAIKFTPQGGSVLVSAAALDAERFRIRVEDSGIGIKPEDLPRLFVEFQRLAAGRAPKQAGTGLGLALTKRIVEAQGGEVSLTSQWGVGSTFCADLPRNARTA